LFIHFGRENKTSSPRGEKWTFVWYFLPFLLGYSQIHQHFHVRIFRTNVVSAAFSSYVPALASKVGTKNARVNVDEIDTWWEWGAGIGRGPLMPKPDKKISSTWKADKETKLGFKEGTKMIRK
jgi:hypothetical protein